MKLSIIVPTRKGSDYLPHCLATCLSADAEDLEVIVSDNDVGTKTTEAVAALSDSRIRYFRAGGNLSMRQNYEFALSKATGDYVIMIGDDDGILGTGMLTLRLILDKYRPDVVNWRVLRYAWPTAHSNGIVKFRRRDFFGPMRLIDPSKVLAQFCSAETTKYKDGANLYHGCVARHIIDSLRERTGEYFHAYNPDMYACLANLTQAKTMVWIKHPVTIGGESEKSIGSAAAKREPPNPKEAANLAELGALANADTIVPELTPGIRRISPYTYAILNRVNELVYDNKLMIHHEKWRTAIDTDMAELPAEEQQSWAAAIQKLYSDMDPRYHPDNGRAPAVMGNSSTAKGNPPAKEHGGNIDPRHLKTVAALANWTNTITAAAYTPSANPCVAIAQQWWKIIGMEHNAKKLQTELSRS